jgi:lipid A 3-O-deacylase
MIRKIAVVAGAFALCFITGPIYAVDSVSVEAGRGNDRTNVLRIAAQWRWRKERPVDERWRLLGYWEASAGAWESADDSSADFALTPVFRVERYGRQRVPYIEAAIGFHILSRHISRERQFSTNFQFGDHIGAGIRSGKYDFGLRAQHISNGGIRHPNPGINFLLLRFQYHLD